MATVNRSRIIDGPGKFDFMLSLFEGKQVYFTIKMEGVNGGPLRLKVQMNSIGIEDGSRESWLIEGYILEITDAWKHFKGYFQSRRRHGWIEFC